MLHCHYKAWQLLEQDTEQALIITQTSKSKNNDKIATAAWNYSEMVAKGRDEPSTEKARKLFEAVEAIASKDIPPSFYKNSHCRECRFWKSCHKQLIEKDCISLLSCMPLTTLS